MRQAMQFLPMTFLQPLENAKSREAVDSAVEVAQKKLRREFGLNAQVAVNRMQTGVLGIPSEVLQKMPPDIREGLYELMTVGMEEELFEKHLTARMLGKAKANGAYVQSDSTDIEAVREIAAKEFAFWQAAARDTVKPRTTRQYHLYRTPEGGFKLSNIKNRVALYANRLDGTFVEGWADAQPRGTNLVWTLAPAEHCPTCKERSGLGPKPLSFWRERGWFPRDGSTICKTNCMCFFAAGGGE